MTEEKSDRIVNKIIEVLINEKLTIQEADDIFHNVRRLINKPISAAIKTELNKVVNKELASGN